MPALVPLISSVFQRTGNFINASEAHRGAFICWMSTPIYLFVLLWSTITLILSQHYPSISSDKIVFLLIWSGVVALLYIPLGDYHLSLTDKPKASKRYTIFVLGYYTITTSITCFLLGPLSVFAGLIVMGSPLLGMMLFSIPLVVFYLVIAIVIMSTASLLVQIGWLDYTPIFNGQSNTYMSVSATIGTIYYTFYEVTIMASLIIAWQSREHNVVHLSLTDPLTGVANRRHILELLDQELTQRRRLDNHLGLIMLDIDHFKQINDKYGHQTGDQVLAAAAAALNACLRQNDRIGRYGGEEFLIILPDSSPEDSLRVAERCRREIANLFIPAKPDLSLTASFGVACQRRHDIAYSDLLIQQADDAMYQAKKNGRNRVEIAKPGLAPVKIPSEFFTT